MRRLTPIFCTTWRSIQGRKSPMRGTMTAWMQPHTSNKATPAHTSVQTSPRAKRASMRSPGWESGVAGEVWVMGTCKSI